MQENIWVTGWSWCVGVIRKVPTDGPGAFDLNINYMRMSCGEARLRAHCFLSLSLSGDSQMRSSLKEQPNSRRMEKKMEVEKKKKQGGS